MTNKIYIKRNTTPSIPIRVDGVNYDNLTKIVFILKSCKHKNTSQPYKKTIFKDDGMFINASTNGFTVILKLTTKETFGLRPGDLFIDVYPFVGDVVINTGEPLRYEVIDTLLDEVIT